MMATAGALLIAGLSAAGSAVTAAALSGGKKQPAPLLPLPVATRDDAREAADRRDELAKRRGVGADVLLGPAGAEAMKVGTKTLTGQ